MFSVKIIKTDDHSVDLIDIFALYRSCEVVAYNKLNFISSINVQKDSLILSPKDSGTPDDLFECPIKFARLKLKSVRSLTKVEIRSIFSMVFNTNDKCEIINTEISFQCESGDRYLELSFDEGYFGILASVKGIAYRFNTLAHINAFLIKNKYDIFRLIKNGYAIPL